MYMTLYGHLTKYHKGNTCLLRQSSSPCSLRGSFISPRGRRFEYRPRGLINEVQLILKNSPKRHFFVNKPGLYTSKYSILIDHCLNWYTIGKTRFIGDPQPQMFPQPFKSIKGKPHGSWAKTNLMRKFTPKIFNCY